MRRGGRMLALIRYNVLAKIGTRRWLAVPFAYLGLSLLFIADMSHGRPEESARSFNVWDVGLCFLFNPYYLTWFVLLGFVLLVGDDLVSGHADGTLRSTLLPSRSALRWWAAKVLSIGVLAFWYMTLFLGCTVVACLLMSIPVQLQDSVASSRTVPDFTSWYPSPAGWSTMAYCIGVVSYTAITLWVVATVYITLSLFVFPHRSAPYLAFVVWLVTSAAIAPADSMVDIRYFLTPGKHLLSFTHTPVPLTSFIGYVTALLAGGVAVGYLRLRRIDL